jgi:hypothetical protein
LEGDLVSDSFLVRPDTLEFALTTEREDLIEVRYREAFVGMSSEKFRVLSVPMVQTLQRAYPQAKIRSDDGKREIEVMLKGSRRILHGIIAELVMQATASKEDLLDLLSATLNAGLSYLNKGTTPARFDRIMESLKDETLKQTLRQYGVPQMDIEVFMRVSRALREIMDRMR